MRTSNSSPVQFIGQGPLPEFDYSQQLPDNIRVLLWMLDGAERRHRLARRWQGQTARDLHVEVEGGDIMITLPGTSYAVTYYKPANSPQLQGQPLPGAGRSTVSDLARGVRWKSLEARQRQSARAWGGSDKTARSLLKATIYG